MKNIKTFESHSKEIKRSNNWKFRIHIKHLLSEEDLSLPSEENKEKVVNISKGIIAELNKLEAKVNKSNLVEDELDIILEELEEIKSNFEFAKDLASGHIIEDDWHEYSFDGNFEELINDYLTQLYDMADKRVLNKNNTLEKFIFVE